jgi:hypothetical protein
VFEGISLSNSDDPPSFSSIIKSVGVKSPHHHRLE